MASSPPNCLSQPTSVPLMDDRPFSSSSVYMQRSSSAGANKVSKRKGTRSVSNLTAVQLAHKRAYDREAQRAIRARIKDHIKRLEAELDELRSVHSRDQAVQDLLYRNKMLEKELKALRDTMGIPSSASFHNSSPYSTPGALASPQTSPYPAGHFTLASSASLPDCPSAAPGFVSSNVSSPCSSATDDYGAGPAYLPTSAPNSNAMVPSPATASLSPEGFKMEYFYQVPRETQTFHIRGAENAHHTATFVESRHFYSTITYKA